MALSSKAKTGKCITGLGLAEYTMALADVCGLKLNSFQNGFLSGNGGDSAHLLDDALLASQNFTLPTDFDVSPNKYITNRFIIIPNFLRIKF